jgi:hypothetical protein
VFENEENEMEEQAEAAPAVSQQVVQQLTRCKRYLPSSTKAWKRWIRNIHVSELQRNTGAAANER